MTFGVVYQLARALSEVNDHWVFLTRGNWRSVLDEVVCGDGRHFSPQLPGVVRELSVTFGGIVYVEWSGAAFSFPPPRIQARSMKLCKAKNVGDVTAGVEDVSGTHGGAAKRKRPIPRNPDGAFLSRGLLQP